MSALLPASAPASRPATEAALLADLTRDLGLGVVGADTDSTRPELRIVIRRPEQVPA